MRPVVICPAFKKAHADQIGSLKQRTTRERVTVSPANVDQINSSMLRT